MGEMLLAKLSQGGAAFVSLVGIFAPQVVAARFKENQHRLDTESELMFFNCLSSYKSRLGQATNHEIEAWNNDFMMTAGDLRKAFEAMKIKVHD